MLMSINAAVNIVTIVVSMLKQVLNTYQLCWFVGPLCGETRFSSGFGYIVAWSQFMSSSLMFEGELYGFFECLHVIWCCRKPQNCIIKT